MIDMHCHVLPGIDDGPQKIDEALALAEAALADGCTTLVATPHVSWHYENDAATITRLVDELSAHLRATPATAAGGGATILTGAEIALTRAPALDSEELRRLGLGASRWLLIEPPATSLAGGIDTVVSDLQARGHGVLLAHPERSLAFHRDPHLLEALILDGALASITAGSLTGRFGRSVRDFSFALLEAGLVHNVASDFHDRNRRPPGIEDALATVGLLPIAEWLTREVPEAILADAQIPARPSHSLSLEAPPRRRRWSRRRR